MFQNNLEEALSNWEEASLQRYGLNSLKKAFEGLSSRYRSESGLYLQTDIERLVYFFTRLPSTFGVACKVFTELKRRLPDFAPKSLFDVGAGPGTCLWASHEVWPDSLKTACLLEKDQAFMTLGKKLAKDSQDLFIQSALWHQADALDPFAKDAYDLVSLSYSLGEMPESHYPLILARLWSLCKQALVIIEPGTPKGYKRILAFREILLGLGASIAAPCPHAGNCPLEGKDWCHFMARIQRSALQRKLKSAELGFEDEKYSYLIVSKDTPSPYASRILRRPVQRPGLVELTLCSESGQENKIFSKRQKEKYKEIKKLNWGDVIY